MFNGGVIVGDSAVFDIKVTVQPGWTNFDVQLTGLVEGNQQLFCHSIYYYFVQLCPLNAVERWAVA